MPNRNSNRRSRRPNRRSRRNIQNTNSVLYPVKVQTTIQTSLAISFTYKAYSTLNLLNNEFSPSNSRSCQLRSVRVYFNPIYNSSVTNPTQPIEVQLYWDSYTTGNKMAMTKSIPLSQTNKTTLGFRLPFNYDEYRALNDTLPLLSIAFFNPFSLTALQVPISFNVELNFAISRDVPNTI
jgi:hypothetical protein